MKDMYSIAIGSTEWYNTGGNNMVAVAQCWLFNVDDSPNEAESCWLAAGCGSFVVYSEYPFLDAYPEDLDVIAQFNLNDCRVQDNHGVGYDFDEWQALGDTMMKLYDFYSSCLGVM